MSISFNELYLAKNEDGHEMSDKLAASRFFFYLLMLGMVLGVAPLIKGGFFVDQHEGDMLHLIDITLRMADGEWPHIDFVTPLGSLAFMPFAALVNVGMGVGAAFLWGQVFFAALVLPMIWWVGVSRLNLVQSYLLGGAVMITALALIYGNTDPYVSMSMHYNRWAWALAFIVVPVATLVPERRIPLADGVILGLAMAFFAFGKITYGVALAPGLVLALILTQQWRAMFFGVMTFLPSWQPLQSRQGQQFGRRICRIYSWSAPRISDLALVKAGSVCCSRRNSLWRMPYCLQRLYYYDEALSLRQG